MLALLKLIPLKDYVYGAIIAGLLISFGAYTLHERHVGEQKIETAVADAVATQQAKNKAVESTALGEVNVAVQKYIVAVAAPSVAAPHIVCHASSGGAVSGATGSSGAGDGSSAVPAESTVPFDPAPGILANDKQADAQVTLLQSYVRACQAAKICAVK
jgi:hypothetical protein